MNIICPNCKHPVREHNNTGCGDPDYKYGCSCDTSVYDIYETHITKLSTRLAALETAGNMMSNVMFNFKQQDRFSVDEKEMMEALQVEWDAIPKSRLLREHAETEPK